MPGRSLASLIVAAVWVGLPAPAHAQSVTASAPARKEPLVLDFGTPKTSTLPIILRAELTCTGSGQLFGLCRCTTPSSSYTVLPGEKGKHYKFSLRVRGVVSLEIYDGGHAEGYWRVGGTPRVGPWPVFSLFVSDSTKQYYLNSRNNDDVVAMDYRATITAEGGSRLTLQGIPARDEMWSNKGSGRQIVLPGIPPAPEVFRGEFVQLDILKMEPQ